MATYYVDPIGGNDANVGTSFATRWQTLTNGATAARIAPGDEIRVIASLDPTSLGQNATWTNNSNTITLTTAVTQDITLASSAWTANANVTTTTSTSRKIGATASQFFLGASFTTGKVAHLDLGSTIDLSGYEQISFWFQQASGTRVTADGTMQIRLCSDANGDTAVNTFNIPRIGATGTWCCFTINNAAALGSSIRSIALYRTTDATITQTFLLNNIFAVKAASAADCLSLTSFISKNDGSTFANEPWFAIQSISGTSVTLMASNTATAPPGANEPGYYGTTQTVTTYVRQPLTLPSSLAPTAAASAFWGTINDEGASTSNRITFTGGWNRTDMSTKTGKTYIYNNNVPNLGQGLSFTRKNFITIDDINVYGYANGYFGAYTLNIGQLNLNISCSDIGACGTAMSGVYANNQGFQTIANRPVITVTNFIQNGNCLSISSGVTNSFPVACQLTFVNAVQNTAAMDVGNLVGFKLVGTNMTFNGRNGSGVVSTGVSLNNSYCGSVTINKIQSLMGANGGQLLAISGGSNNKIRISENLNFNSTTAGSAHNIVLSSTVDNYIDLTGATVSGGFAINNAVVSVTGVVSNVIISGGTWSLLGSGNLLRATNNAYGTLIVDNVTTSNSLVFSTAGGVAPTVIVSRPGGVVNNTISYLPLSSNITPVTTPVRTAGGLSWRMISGNFVASDCPVTLPVGQYAVNSGSLVTASVWVYLTNAAITARLVCKGGQIAGVSSDVVATASTGTLNAWQQLTITFTPSAQGAVVLQVETFGGTGTQYVYVDDITVSQA